MQIRIMEVIDGSDYLGLNGESFKMKVSEKLRTGDIISDNQFDWYAGKHIEVPIDSEIKPDNEGWICDFRLVTNDHTEFYSKEKMLGALFHKYEFKNENEKG